MALLQGFGFIRPLEGGDDAALAKCRLGFGLNTPFTLEIWQFHAAFLATSR